MTAKAFNDKYFGDGATAAPFRDDVRINWAGAAATVTGKAETVSNVNPVYCATDDAARDLSSLLSDLGKVEIFRQGPLGEWPQANVFTQSDDVPWIRVTDVDGFSTIENAGQMVSFFSHGYPPDVANEWMRQQFTMDLKAQHEAARSAS